MSSKIAWTDESWNPVVGCTKVSPGCDNCYAEKMAHRLACMEDLYFEEVKEYAPAGSTFGYKYFNVMKNGKWNGRTQCDEPALDKPLHWKKPRRIFVPSMGDLFHPTVPFEFVDKVMATLVLCPQHTGQILTKRSERMLEYFQSDRDERSEGINDAIEVYTGGHLAGHDMVVDFCKKKGITYKFRDRLNYNENIWVNSVWKKPLWPQPNIWLGVTAEKQEWWEKRKEDFFNTPAAVHFVSNEPLLGEIKYTDEDLKRLDWVIVGAESGPKRRFCKPEWIDSIVCQCKVVKVPVFVKQIHMPVYNRLPDLIKDPAGWPREYPEAK